MNHVLCVTQVAKTSLGLLTFLCCRRMNLTNLGYCVLSISTLKMNCYWSLQNNFDIDTSDCIGSSWNVDWTHTMKSSNLLSMSFEYVILLPFILLNMNYCCTFDSSIDSVSKFCNPSSKSWPVPWGFIVWNLHQVLFCGQRICQKKYKFIVLFLAAQ